MAKPILYSYYRSSCSYRVRIALALKGIDYEYRPINLIKDGGEQFKEDYKKINPQVSVPTLVINDKVLTQSMAILEFLEEFYTGIPHFLPKDIYERSRVRALSQLIASDIQPLQNLKVLKMVTEYKPDWAAHWIEIGFKALETLLSNSPNKSMYCVGNEVTMADILLVPQVYSALRFNINVENYPRINEIYRGLIELDAFKKAHPSAQPDCPPEFK